MTANYETSQALMKCGAYQVSETILSILFHCGALINFQLTQKHQGTRSKTNLKEAKKPLC